MHPTNTRLRPSRPTLYAGLGVAVLGATTLIATTAAVHAATDAVVALTSSGIARAADPDLTSAPTLAQVVVPPAPAGCSPDALADRAGQVAQLAGEQAAERRAVTTVAGPNLADQLGEIRGRADLIVHRIAQIDTTCAPAG